MPLSRFLYIAIAQYVSYPDVTEVCPLAGLYLYSSAELGLRLSLVALYAHQLVFVFGPHQSRVTLAFHLAFG